MLTPVWFGCGSMNSPRSPGTSAPPGLGAPGGVEYPQPVGADLHSREVQHRTVTGVPEKRRILAQPERQRVGVQGEHPLGGGIAHRADRDIARERPTHDVRSVVPLHHEAQERRGTPRAPVTIGQQPGTRDEDLPVRTVVDLCAQRQECVGRGGSADSGEGVEHVRVVFGVPASDQVSDPALWCSREHAASQQRVVDVRGVWAQPFRPPRRDRVADGEQEQPARPAPRSRSAARVLSAAASGMIAR
jgi:hypothetical protein